MPAIIINCQFHFSMKFKFVDKCQIIRERVAMLPDSDLVTYKSNFPATYICDLINFMFLVFRNVEHPKWSQMPYITHIGPATFIDH